MVASSPLETSIIRQVDPYVLEETLENLSALSGNAIKTDLPLNASGSPDDYESDNVANRPYLETSFNEIEGKGGKKTYRSPWVKTSSNAAGEEEIMQFEKSANELWDAYRNLYYGHTAIGSVYIRRKGSDSSGASPTKSKKSSSNALEALFGIQNKCIVTIGGDDDKKDDDPNAEKKEIARWDSIHCVTINALNYDQKTCEYNIESKFWCRFNPEDTGDVTPEDKEKAKKQRQLKKPPAAAKPKAKPKKNAKLLNKERMEMFDKVKDNFGKHADKDKAPVIPKKKFKPDEPPPPPISADVKSSAYYQKETTKVCKFVGAGTGSNPKIPSASHIENIGTLIEKIETDVRSKLERLDVPKTCEAIQSIYRKVSPAEAASSPTPRGMPGINPHATGMGMGAGLIAEMALKAKKKGLGEDGGGGGGGKDINKAMENLILDQKKKLSDNSINTNDEAATATTNGLKSSSREKSPASKTTPTPRSTSPKPPSAPPTDKGSNSSLSGSAKSKKSPSANSKKPNSKQSKTPNSRAKSPTPPSSKKPTSGFNKFRKMMGKK